VNESGISIELCMNVKTQRLIQWTKRRNGDGKQGSRTTEISFKAEWRSSAMVQSHENNALSVKG
jgi:hypothetical protein